MGAWGTAIFSDDEACDIRTEYNAMAAYIDDDKLILKKLKDYFHVKSELNDMDAVFWYAVAAQQVKYGRLCDEVRENALECIKRRYTFDGWYNKKDCAKRAAVLGTLKEQLTSQQPLRRKISKPKRFKAIWQQADVVAYHLVNIVADQYRKPEDYWFYGKYILLKVVKVIRTPLSKIMPELACDEWMYCSVYDWIGDEIPDINIINDLNFHPISFNEYRNEHDYVTQVLSSVVNPSYKRKHDAVIIGKDSSGKMPPRLDAYSYIADVIEFTLERMPKFTPGEIGYYNKNGMP